MASNLEVIISATDRFTGTANRVIGTLGRMDTAAGRVGKGIGQLGMGLGRVGLIAAGAAAGGLIAVTKASINWETALAGVNKTMDVTPKELQAIGTEIRTLATNIPLSATAIAGLVEQAGALGIAKENVVEFARVAATIGVTTNVSADQAAASLGVMANLLGLTGKDYEKFASTLVDLGNKGASTEQQILAIAERAAGMGATIGLTAEQILGFSSAVANIGMEPEAAGSSLQRWFMMTAQYVNDGTGIIKKALKDGVISKTEAARIANSNLGVMAEVAGVSVTAYAKQFEKAPAEALSAFISGLGQLTTNERLDVLEQLGWDDRIIGRMFTGLAEAEDKNNNLEKSLSISAAAWRANTAAAEEADKRYGTVGSKLTLLKNQAVESAIIIGEGFLPALGRTADKLKAILADPAGRSALADLGRDLGQMLDSIDWRKVIDGAKTFLDVVKAAFDIISKIPAEITASVAGFVGLNKLSGGLIGQGIANIVGGLIGGLSRGVAAKIPGVGSLFAQPVYVVNWPAGGVGPGGLGPGGVGGGVFATAAGFAAAATTLIGLLGGAAVIGQLLAEQFNPPGSKPSEIKEKVDNGSLDFNGRVFYTTGDRPARSGGLSPDERQAARSGGMSPEERQDASEQKRKIDLVRAAMNNQGRNITAAINRLDMKVTVPVTVRVSGNTITRQTGTTLVRLGSGPSGTGAELGM